MAKVTRAKDDIKVEARLSVTIAGEVQTVRRFDRAWVIANDAANAGSMPIGINLDGFVRKDIEQDEFVIRY